MNSDFLKNIINKGKEIYNKVDIDDYFLKIQEVMKLILPINIQIKDSLNEKKIIITEEDLNIYLNSKLKELNGVKAIKLKIYDNKYFELFIDSKKYFINTKINQKFLINSFILKEEDGIINLELNDKLNIEAKDIISKILLYIISYILKSTINNNLLSLFNNSNHINFKENFISINLKEGILKKMYEYTLNDYLKKEIPIIGNRKIIELVNIEEIETKESKLLINFKVKVF